MINIPQCFYNRALINKIDTYIDEGYKSYNALDDNDKELLAADCIELYGDDACEAIINPDNFDAISGLFVKFLRTARSEHSFDLMAEMAKNTTNYFTGALDALFEERISVLQAEKMVEYGFHPTVDNINGEISWRKYA